MSTIDDQGVIHQPPALPRQILAEHWGKGRAVNPRVVVIHATDDSEKPGSALAIAKWFAGHLGPHPRTSAHWVVDAKEAVSCVDERDRAWHAPGANDYSIGIELCGKASQTAAEWDDAVSAAEVQRAADLVAQICRRWSIPVRRLSADQLLAGEAGVCGHDTVTTAYPDLGDHWDPGPSFNWPRFISAVAAAMG